MANLNFRQTNFITELKAFANSCEALYNKATCLKKCYDEEFATGKDNDLSNAENLEVSYNFDSDDVATAVNQAVDNFKNLWEGNVVDTREYGKDLRRIK